jgi:hypothetical protein
MVAYDAVRADTRESAWFAKRVTKGNGIAGNLDAFLSGISTFTIRMDRFPEGLPWAQLTMA